MGALNDWFTSDTANTNWTSSGNTSNVVPLYRGLRGPTYRVSQATLIVRETSDHKPETFANIGGVQFKRTTRRGGRHYYRAVK